MTNEHFVTHFNGSGPLKEHRREESCKI